MFTFNSYLVCGRVLNANQDPRAKQILARGRTLLHRRAAKTEDETLRSGFLHDHPIHRQLLTFV